MTQINPYLTFGGNCREAMLFYHQCLGGDLDMKSFKDSPMAANMPPSEQEKIMHANIRKDSLILMASDGGEMNGKLVKGNMLTLSLNCSTEAEIDSFFEKLSAGGTITMPLSDQFWGAKFGMFADKFGVDWMLNFDRNPQ